MKAFSVYLKKMMTSSLISLHLIVREKKLVELRDLTHSKLLFCDTKMPFGEYLSTFTLQASISLELSCHDLTQLRQSVLNSLKPRTSRAFCSKYN